MSSQPTEPASLGNAKVEAEADAQQSDHSSDGSAGERVHWTPVEDRRKSRAGSKALARRSSSGPRRQPLDFEPLLTITKLAEFERQFNQIAASRPGVPASRGLDMYDFRKAVRAVIGRHVTDEEADIAFWKVDVLYNEAICWRDYMNYLLLLTAAKQKMAANSREPYNRDIRLLKTTSNQSTVDIMFMPMPRKNASRAPVKLTESAIGKYMAISRDGILTTFNSQLAHPVIQQITTPNSPVVPIFVTCTTFMPAANVLVIATSNCDLLFYTYNSDKFERASRIWQLPLPFTCMSYYCDPFVRDRQSYLAWGDEKGGLGVIVFKEPPEMTRLCSLVKTEEDLKVERSFLFIQVTYKSVTGVLARYLSGIHNRYVVRIRYYESRRVWFSSCHDKSTALFLGDIVKMPAGTEHLYYVVDDGVQAFDYCRRLNMIVTGGLSGKIGLWNPEANTKSKLVGHLEGHTSAITQLEIAERREMLVSVAENKDVRIYDLASQNLIQVFFRKAFTGIGLRPMNALYVNQVTNKIIIASKNLMTLDVRVDDPAMIPLASHNRPINVILYNELFKQLVSADQNSLVCVWDVMTGRKTLEFTAHTSFQGVGEKGVEVTAMSFDPNHRRLMTAMQDGTVKLWNFSNGNCLHTLWKADNKEVSAVAWAKGRIMVGGWNHRILVYPDLTGQKKARGLRPPSRDDVTSLAVFPPRYAASGCADGSIMIWSLETLHPLFKYYSNQPMQRAMNNFKLVIVERPAAVKTAPTSRSKHIMNTKNEDDDDEEGEATSAFEYIEGLPPVHMADDDGSSILTPEHTVGENNMIDSFESESERTNELFVPGQLNLKPSPVSNEVRHTDVQPADIEHKPEDGAPKIHVHNMGGNACGPDLSGKVTAGVEVLIYLHRRPLQNGTAVLLSGLSDGWVLGWPMNSDGGRCLGRFLAVSSADETLAAAAVTDDNEFLISGDSNGYIKVWDISHYLVADILCDDETDHLRWNVWRDFPFVVMRVSTDCIPRDHLGRLPLHLTQRCTRPAPPLSLHDEKLDGRPPHLINSLRGHLAGISCLTACSVYKRRLIASASSDLSIRLWTLEGQFLGVFGRPDVWTDLGPLVTAPIIKGLPLAELLAKRRKSATQIVEKKLSLMSSAGNLHRKSALMSAPRKISQDEEAVEKFRTSVDERQSTTIPDKPKPAEHDDFDDWINVAAQKTVDGEADDDEEEEEEEECFDTFDVEEAVLECRDRRLMFTAAVELAARMELLDPNKSISRVEMVTLDSSKASLPSDIRRVASYTTLYVLESGLGKRSTTRWVKVRQAICWMKCYWESRRSGASMTDLVKGEAESAAPFGNMLKDMIESHENDIQDALNKKTGANDGEENTKGAEAMLAKLGLPLLPPKAKMREDDIELDGSDACRLGHYGRVPLTKSTILGTAYKRTLTHYRPWPPVVLPKPLEHECHPYHELPLEPMGQMDGCRIALNDRVHASCREFHLPPLPCKWKKTNMGIDLCQQLADSIQRLGWRAAADGSFKRCIMPINLMNTRKSLQPPVYSCDIEALKLKFEMERMRYMNEGSSRNSRSNSVKSNIPSRLLE